MQYLEVFLALKFLRSKNDRFFSFTSLISILSITLSISILIVILSITDGFQRELQNKIIGAGAHIQAERLGGLKNWEEDFSRLAQDPSVLAASPFISNQGFLDINGDLQYVGFTGIDPNLERPVSRLENLITSGNLSSLHDNQIIIGQELANRYGLKIGYPLFIFLPQFKERKKFEVAGIFYSGIYYLDLSQTYLSLNTASTLFKTNERISGFRIKIRNEDAVNTVTAQLSDKLGGLYTVQNWRDQNTSLVEALQVERRIMLIIVFSLVLISCFTIASSLMIKVITKFKDIGILRSLGLPKSSIRRIFLIQGMIIGIIGCSLGFGLGSLAAININEISHLLDTLFHFQLIPDNVYYMSSIPVSIKPEHFVFSGLLSILFAFIASFFPAWRASRLEIIEVIRND